MVGAYMGGEQFPALLDTTCLNGGKDHLTPNPVHAVGRLVHLLRLNS